MHKDLIPPENPLEKDVDRFKTPWVTEYDVMKTLRENGREPRALGVDADIGELVQAIKEESPSLVFNLLEQFNNDPAMDYHVVTLLELHGLVYTGCNPKGLVVGRDKALSKKILKYHKIATPKFFTVKAREKLKIPKKVEYPLIVKCALEEASYGIAKASVVNNLEKLQERVEYLQKELGQDVIIEEFVEGKEVYVGVIGNKNLKVLPAWELKYNNVDKPEKEIYSQKAKWDFKYRQRKGIDHARADISEDLEKKVQQVCKKTYRALGLSGYARVDLRIDKEEKIHVLEANPNPNIAWDDEFAQSAKHAGISYSKLIELIIKAAQRPDS